MLPVTALIWVSSTHAVQVLDSVSAVAGKHVDTRSVPGPVGVMSRNFSNARIYSIGWQSKFDLRAGIERTYPWIAQQVKTATVTV